MYRFACVSLTALAVGMVGGAAFGQQSTETYTYDALGRLVVADTTGGQNDGQAHSICYDAVGNRKSYVTKSDRTIASCVATGSPTPTPTPTPSNNPPIPVSDSATVDCNSTGNVDLTSNDSDPEGNYPLNLVSVGSAFGLVTDRVSSTTASFSPIRAGTYTIEYTVEDSLGATAIGIVTIVVPTTGCGPLL